MIIARKPEELIPFHGGVFVPTMGALHAGHIALLRRARDVARRRQAEVIVSVFVNPTQFDDPSDFERYPRTLEGDAARCGDEGVACVWAPGVETIYPPGESVRVPELPSVATRPGLEDRFRPGHFEGVCQVCARLFELVRPGAAVFGEKDWQQLRVIESMVQRSFPDLEIVAHPTVRDSDGLALSSRNERLTGDARSRARAIPRALVEAGREADAAAAERRGREVLERAGIVAEYVAVRDAETLDGARPDRAARVLAAGMLDGVRLIDNAAWPGFSLPASVAPA